MENYGKSKKNRRSSSSSKIAFGSIVLVFVAVLSVVAISFGRSYAVDTVVNRLPDTFETAAPTKQLHSVAIDGSGDFSTFPYFTKGGIQVFCLEHTRPYVADKTFNKGAKIEDQGLLYLLANIYPNVKYEASLNDDLCSWISQVAIWVYLYENEKLANGGTLTDENNLHYLSDAEIQAIKGARGIFIDDDFATVYTANGKKAGVSASDPLLYDKYIKPLVDAAFANKEVKTPSLSINFGSDVAITQDNKYYQTSQVSVSGTPSENLNGYEVKINSAPEGTFVVDVNGNKIEDLTKLSATDKFYFRIPVDKVTEDNKVVKFSVNASFRGYSGFYYIADNAQTITGVSTEDIPLSDGAEIPINYTPKVPDTGMSTAQTVYFIGLIILLSGVGIIYANVKPKEGN